jgi:hypothetical protein
MRTGVHQWPPPSVTCPDTTGTVAGERRRTGVNETETETRSLRALRVRHASQAGAAGRNSAGDGLDTLQLPEFFLVVGRLVQVKRELAV